jgi:hypothetical protein
MRPALCLLALAALSPTDPAPSPPDAATEEKAQAVSDFSRETLEVVAFNDVDDVVVKIDGKERNAYLIGLRPFREVEADKDRREAAREEMAAVLEKSDLLVGVVARKGRKLGLTVSTYGHLSRYRFKEGWNPEYPWCAVGGWGEYNLNLYFLHRDFAAYDENFGDTRRWKDLFAKVVRKEYKQR